MELSRRQFLAALAAGGTVVAGKLWVPGQKLISIPNIVTGPTLQDCMAKFDNMPPYHINCRAAFTLTPEIIEAIMKNSIRDAAERVMRDIVGMTPVDGGALRNYVLPERKRGTVVVTNP